MKSATCDSGEVETRLTANLINTAALLRVTHTQSSLHQRRSESPAEVYSVVLLTGLLRFTQSETKAYFDFSILFSMLTLLNLTQTNPTFKMQLQI